MGGPDDAMFRLDGRVALVTGAGRGLGQAIALALAAAGARIVACGRERLALDDTLERISAAGGRGIAACFDVRDPAASGVAIAAAARDAGGLDVLVNNAGVEQVCPALDVTPELWDRIHDSNLRGAFFCAQAAARAMVAAGSGGAVVNLCSLTSFVGIPTAAPYGASKAGLLGLTRALAVEWAPLGIRVNALAPGYFRTAMTEAFYADPGWQAARLARIPLGRFGAPGDLAGAAVFLGSDAAAYMTGQCLTLDGGMLSAL